MSYVSTALRQRVIQRANNCCEYCRVHAEQRHFPYEIDHIIAENLCWSCYICNGYSGQLTPLFNPRLDQWDTHFQLDAKTARIIPQTPEGRVTVFLLRLNHDEQLMARMLLIAAELYPCSFDQT